MIQHHPSILRSCRTKGENRQAADGHRKAIRWRRTRSRCCQARSRLQGDTHRSRSGDRFLERFGRIFGELAQDVVFALIFRSVGFISAFDKTKLCSHSGRSSDPPMSVTIGSVLGARPGEVSALSSALSHRRVRPFPRRVVRSWISTHRQIAVFLALSGPRALVYPP